MVDEKLEEVKNIFVKRLGVERESIQMDSHLVEDLDADSLFIVELVVDIEKIFNIQIPDDEIDDIQTVGDVMSYIKN